MKPTTVSDFLRPLLFMMLLAGVGSRLPAASISLPTSDLELKSPKYAPAVKALRANDFVTALRLGADLLAKEPADASAHLLRTLAFAGQEHPLQAMDQAVLAQGHGGKDAVVILHILASTYARSSRYYLALACLQRAETISGTPEVKRDMARLYLTQGRAAKARPLLELLPPDKADPEALSRACLMLGDLPAAKAAARRAIELNPKNTGALVLRGTAELLAGETADAEATFRQLKRDGNDALVAGHYLGLAALVRQDYSAALTEMQALLQKSPKLREAHLITGLSQHMQAHYTEARQSASAVLAENPNDAIAGLLLAAARIGEGRKDEAQDALQRSDAVLYEFAKPFAGTVKAGMDWNPDQAGRFATASYLLTEGLARDARSWAAGGDTAAAPTDPALALLTARIDLALGRRVAAGAAFAALGKRDDRLVTPWLELAQMATDDGQPAKTREYLQQALARPVGSVRVHLVAGELAYRADLHDLAEAQFRRVVEMDPESAIGLNQLAWTLAAKLARPAEALPFATTALRLDSGNLNTIDTAAWTNHLLGHDDEASRLYQPLLKTLPRNAGTLYHMSKVFQKTGRTAVAAELLEKALNLSDDFPDAMSAETALQSYWAAPHL